MVGPLLVILLAFSVAVIPQFVYFEISFLVRRRRKKPRFRECLAVSAAVSIGLLIYGLYGGSGESELAFMGSVIGFTPIVFITGIPVLWVYQIRNRSLFKSKIDADTGNTNK